MDTTDVLILVRRERARQDELKNAGRFKATCADDYLDDAEKLAVLMEEVGECARAVLERDRLVSDTHYANLKQELIQVAAVAVAWAESL